MATINLSPKGLEEVKDFINPDRINRKLAIGVGQVVLQLHDALRSAVARNYTIRASLDTALVGRSISNVEIGKNFIRVGLLYTDKQKDLSKTPYTWNETHNSGIESVEVKRGRVRLLRGRAGHGGFIPRKAGSPPNRYGSHGTQLFERIGLKRYPLRLLLAPSLSDLANHMYEKDPKVQSTLSNVETYLANLLDELK